jgi:hypothetical protein
MVVDHFIDMEESGGLWMCGWRCVACGDVVDPEIMRRRVGRLGLDRVVAAVKGLRKRKKNREVVRLSA